MNAADVLASGFRYLHEALREDISGISDEKLWWQPQRGANPAGFLLWHIVRDEDDVVSFARGSERLWKSERWFERFGMSESEQGTGFTAGEVAVLRYPFATLREYAEAVWPRTEREVPQLTDADLERPAFGDWTVERLLNEGCLCHSWLHLGEVRYVRGLQGWRARE
ncbi:MAG: DinB family protein [Hyphomicrobiales bacterium]